MLHQQQLVARLKELPTLPITVLRVLRAVSDDRSSANSLENIIKPDMALSANLLRLANSAAFGLPRKVSVVQQAIALLGNKQVSQLVTGLGFANVIPPSLPGYGISSKEFWLHSVAVAFMAEALCNHVDLGPEAAGAFTTGLLHDVGKLAVAAVTRETADTVVERVEQELLDFVEAERRALGTDHCQIGSLLVSQWQLPAEIGDVAYWHHWPDRAQPNNASRRLVALIHVADCMSYRVVGLGSQQLGTDH
jgi:putative nucleotidyltransferase with HDIG domain